MAGCQHGTCLPPFDFDALLVVFFPQNVSLVTENVQIICPQNKAFLEIVNVICGFQTRLCIKIISVDFNKYTCSGPDPLIF